MKWLLTLVVAIAAIVCFAITCRKDTDEALFTYPESEIWGKSGNDTSISPYTVKIASQDMEDLKQRIARWRRHETLEGVGRSYGITADRFNNLIKYWREKYDFSKFESKLNSLPQFTTVIQGLRVHFLHLKADRKAKRVVPLLLVHGWPGSIVEFYRAIPLLTAVGEDGTAFDIVAPSIPGFGFSEASAKPGFNPIAAAQVFHTLMKRLGYEYFVYQGGDWGAIIGALLSRIYPDSVIGYHTNLVPIPSFTLGQKFHFLAAATAPSLVLDKNDAKKLQNISFLYILEEFGFFHEQATKPETIGAALTDSPVGFAAWVAEKFESIAERAEFKGDSQGISNEDLITNIMVYWLTNHVTSSVRIYKEFIQAANSIAAWSKQPIEVPVGVACYPAEILCTPKALLKSMMPRLVHYEDIANGGHFAAMEEPELFVRDLRTAVAKFHVV